MEKTIKQKIVEISNELRIEKEGKNSFQNYDYFRPDDIAKAINPLMEKHGIIIMFNMPFSAEKQMYEGSLIVEDIKTAEKVEYKFDIPLTEVKGSSKAQGAGATQTYCKRYMIMNAFNIADNSDDLDGKSPLEKKINKEAEAEKAGGDVCPKCGEPMKLVEGIKNGKPWRGMFCKSGNKDHTIWLPRTIDEVDENNY